MLGVVIAIALASMAWALVYWDVERRKLGLETHAQSLLKGEVESLKREAMRLRELDSAGLASIRREIAVTIEPMTEDLTSHHTRLNVLEQSMRDLGNPKPMRAAQAARIDPFGRHK